MKLSHWCSDNYLMFACSLGLAVFLLVKIEDHVIFITKKELSFSIYFFITNISISKALLLFIFVSYLANYRPLLTNHTFKWSFYISSFLLIIYLSFKVFVFPGYRKYVTIPVCDICYTGWTIKTQPKFI